VGNSEREEDRPEPTAVWKASQLEPTFSLVATEPAFLSCLFGCRKEMEGWGGNNW